MNAASPYRIYVFYNYIGYIAVSVMFNLCGFGKNP